jgi:hypothetical protein
MFFYLTSYRFYTLAKIGFSLAYLWFITDFFRIHVAYWNGLSSLLSNSSETVPSVNFSLDDLFAGKICVWVVFVASPFIAGLYLWGRHRWLQLAVGSWMNLSMISMISFVGIFCSTADIWLSYVFLTYSLSALICPSSEWSSREPGFSRVMWREDPILRSTYAWLIVLVQFTVYFFAGVNKLVFGWEPWTTGTALQNLSIDSSMHDYCRGIPVPFWISFILCYITLMQRFVVPFGFFFMRYRGWAVLILGAMHAGYDLLMQVAIFPVIGVSSLLMIVPPRSLALPLFSLPSLHQPRAVRRLLQNNTPLRLLPRLVLILFSISLLLESTRMTISPGTFWENRLIVVPAWRMFADGGENAGESWRLIFQTPNGEIDETDQIKQMLPHLWRDRFYLDEILHEVLAQPPGQFARLEPLAADGRDNLYRT